MRGSHSAVIARLDRATQYAAAYRVDRRLPGVLDPRFRGDDGWRAGSKMNPNEARVALNTGLAILALVALRLIAAAFTPITFDEAYYWMWSKHLAGGYYDHPPMVAVVIRLGTLIAGDTEFGVRLVSILLALPMSWAIYQAAAILFGSRRVAASSAILLNITLMAAVGTMIVTPDAPLLVASSLLLFALAKVLQTGHGAVVAGGRRRRRLRAAVEIHRAVLRAGDPDLAGRRSQAAALADLALALSRRARRAGAVCAGHSLERRAPLGFLHQADGAGEDRGFPPGLHRRTDPDADRVRDAAGVDARRDGALRAVPPTRRRAAGARARQYDVLGHRRLFRLALAACPRRGQLVCAGLSGVCDRRRRRRASGRMGAALAARWSISAGAGRCRAAS